MQSVCGNPSAAVPRSRRLIERDKRLFDLQGFCPGNIRLYVMDTSPLQAPRLEGLGTPVGPAGAVARRDGRPAVRCPVVPERGSGGCGGVVLPKITRPTHPARSLGTMKKSFPNVWFFGLAAGALVAVEAPAAEAGKPAAPPGAALNASEAEVLLNLFQEKGLISPQDVEKARAELARRATAAAESAPAPKLKLADWIKGLELYGDARLRYEYRAGEDLNGDHLERNRWRYRVRVGANLRFTDHLRAGLRLESGPGGRSSNVTFGDDAGPWGKDSDRIHLGLLFLTWEPAGWFSATAGRQEIPFKTTSLVWDHDLTPEGLSESFKYTVGRFDLFATFGQFVYDDANPDNPLGGVSYTDAFLLGQQVGARFNLNSNLSAQVAPVLYAYSGGGDSFNARLVGNSASSSVGVNNLLVLEVPAEVRGRLGPVPLRVFGDFAVNLEGDERAARAGGIGNRLGQEAVRLEPARILATGRPVLPGSQPGGFGCVRQPGEPGRLRPAGGVRVHRLPDLFPHLRRSGPGELGPADPHRG